MSQLKPPAGNNDHMQGPADAIITLVEYGDFECPHCGAAYPVIKEIQQTFKKQLRFVYRPFPLSNVHPHALQAAAAAEAADRQHGFWPMHDLLFENQDRLDRHNLAAYANALKLDPALFKADMDDPAIAEKIEASFESGVRSGVNGTPSFFINGSIHDGGHDYSSLERAIRMQIEPAY